MITKDGYRYVVENKIAELWHPTQDISEAPCHRQDMNPVTGEFFQSDAEAIQWIEEFIDTCLLPPAEEIPPAPPVTE